MARAQRKTLNAAFREWLLQFTAQFGNAREMDALMRRLRHVNPGRRFVRDEMNERQQRFGDLKIENPFVDGADVGWGTYLGTCTARGACPDPAKRDEGCTVHTKCRPLGSGVAR
ncbi:MAG TPA: hypothetical protein VF783_17070 [Terriglobales bacterium]